MKFTKFKILGLLVWLALAAAIPVKAQNFVSQSFMNQSVLVLTNTLQFTNLASIGCNPSNTVGALYTNFQGTRVIAAAGDYHNAFKDVDLYPMRDGEIDPLYYATGTNILQNIVPSHQQIFVKLVGINAAANSAVTFTMFPVPDGTTECNAAATTFTFAVTANGTTPVTLVTNIPSYLWTGCAKLRCNRIVNGDADANSQVNLTDFSLNGYRP